MSVSASPATLARPEQGTAAPHLLAKWARHHQALQASSIEEVIHRAQGHPRADDTCPASSDEVYNALIAEHLAGDRTATSTLIAAMWPALIACLRRYPSHDDDLAQSLILALIEALPQTHGTTFIASQLRWAIRAQLRRCTTRRPRVEQLTRPIPFDRLTTIQHTSPRSDHGDHGDHGDHHGVWKLLLDARAAGVITAHEADLLVHLYGLDGTDPEVPAPTSTEAAATYGISPAALRQRASRAAAKVRAAVNEGTIALHTL